MCLKFSNEFQKDKLGRVQEFEERALKGNVKTIKHFK
jgi:hypothetical protein